MRTRLVCLLVFFALAAVQGKILRPGAHRPPRSYDERLVPRGPGHPAQMPFMGKHCTRVDDCACLGLAGGSARRLPLYAVISEGGRQPPRGDIAAVPDGVSRRQLLQDGDCGTSENPECPPPTSSPPSPPLPWDDSSYCDIQSWLQPSNVWNKNNCECPAGTCLGNYDPSAQNVGGKCWDTASLGISYPGNTEPSCVLKECQTSYSLDDAECPQGCTRFTDDTKNKESASPAAWKSVSALPCSSGVAF
jgi:hypothetical protein